MYSFLELPKQNDENCAQFDDFSEGIFRNPFDL